MADKVVYIGQDESSASQDSLDQALQGAREMVNEVEHVKPKVEEKAPEKVVLREESSLKEMGQGISLVENTLVVQATPGHIVHLDSWVYDAQRQPIGYVADILGRVEQPFYAIKMQQPRLLATVYYAEGACNIIQEEDIKSMRAQTQLEDSISEGENQSEEEKSANKRAAERERSRDNREPRENREEFYRRNYQQMMRMQAPQMERNMQQQYQQQMEMQYQQQMAMQYQQQMQYQQMQQPQMGVQNPQIQPQIPQMNNPFMGGNIPPFYNPYNSPSNPFLPPNWPY